MTDKNIQVLIADDCTEDRSLLRRAINSCPNWQLVGEVDCGDSLLSYLQGKGKFSDRNRYPLPDLLLMDAILPRGNTSDVINWTKKNSRSVKTILCASTLLTDYCNMLLEQGAYAWFHKTDDPRLLETILKKIAAEIPDYHVNQCGGAVH